MFKRFILIILLSLTMTYSTGCSSIKSDGEKKLIGFTIFEKNTQIGLSQKINNLNEININGFYADTDYASTSFIGDSYFNIKVEYSQLQGDLITPDSICLFVNANYYQAQNVLHKLFFYEIYLLKDGTYSVEYKDEIVLSPILEDSKIVSSTIECVRDSLNYVFTYKINVMKIPSPKETIIREFDYNNNILNTRSINSDTQIYTISDKAAYAIIEEKYSYTNENEEEVIDFNYILLTRKTEKLNYVFKTFNNENRIISYQVAFKFDTEEEKTND